MRGAGDLSLVALLRTHTDDQGVEVNPKHSASRDKLYCVVNN